jgi:hypothetical protein
MSSETLDPAVAEAVLRAWDGRKVTLASGKTIVQAWLGVRHPRDAWGNFIVKEGQIRWHFGKQTVKQQEKSFGEWRDRKSLGLIDAANVLLTKAARTLGREAELAKLLGQRAARGEQKEKRTSRASQKRLEEQAQVWATKLVSQRDPEAYVRTLTIAEKSEARDTFLAAARETYQQCLKQLEAGGSYSDAEIVSTEDPPFAAFFDKRCVYEWNEDVQGVPYTFFVKQKEVDLCEVHVGRPTESGMTGRIDPMTHMESWAGPTVGAKGDGYISGLVQRKIGQAPTGVLFFISAHEKKKGSGTRMLDAWCSLMSGWGVDRWIAQAVGEEGEAFITARVRAGRLVLHGRRGHDLVLSCVGDPA